MEPNYVAKRSAVGKGGVFVCILLSPLIVPIIMLIWKIICAKNEYVEFYDDKVISRSGVLSKHEHQSTLTKITGVTVNQSFKGRIFNYGDVRVDVIGQFDIDLQNIKKPYELKKYLEARIAKSSELNQYVMD